MCWRPEYIILIIVSTLIDYYAAIQMGKYSEKAKKKKFLLLSLFSNLGLLFAFKYFNFFNNSFNELFDSFNIMYNVPTFNLLLPVGISFYTFQTLSYSIDVYKGKKEPEKHLGIFAVYVSFFPQLVAGPIERSTTLLPQFRKKISPNYNNITDGLKLMMWGFFKKIVIADRLAVVVNNVYNNVHDHNSLSYTIATLFFAFQIYCDFSGYSDIAIGASQVMGYNLMDNFKRPYYSKNIAEFWRRWHISLSTWFKDYLYIPLGGNRVSKARIYFNLYLTFLISGIWHGANWTFVMWGSLHGFYLIFGKITYNFRTYLSQKIFNHKFNNFRQYFNIITTFILVCFAWIFFRANNLSDGFYIIKNILLNSTSLLDISSYKETFATLGLETYELVIAFVSIILLETFHLLQRHQSIRHMLRDKPLAIRWSIYFALILLVLLWGYSSEQAEFIYFQF
jgi:alginate O-acetyltransferase complex protein AlgI